MNQARPKSYGRRDGYIAAIISQSAAARLSALAVHPDIYCRHMMAAYRPDATAWERFGNLVGQSRGLTVVGIAQDERAQAVLVTGCPSENEHPHITVSCARGVPPAYTIQMVARAVAEGRVQSLDLGVRVINAHIKFKPFSDYQAGTARRVGWSKSDPEGG